MKPAFDRGPVKHMRRSHQIMTARIGRSWRTMFQITDDRLVVLELVHRQELENAIDRLRRSF